MIDRYNELVTTIVEQEKRLSLERGDHFAEGGANDRVWNSLQKCCVENPQLHIEYYSNQIIALASEAWLGPAYQVTAQVNAVKPGGQAQMPHCDYHLGFQNESVLERFPMHAHNISRYLTLQGAVAHTDMSVASGPTLLLPYSHQHQWGYFAWRHQPFIDYFDEHAVQLPLKKGDMVFFNPSLFHAAGSNQTEDVYRCANLLQVSSAFGRSTESVDRYKMSLASYSAFQSIKNQLSSDGLLAAIAATAEGYSFPTNLDLDPPLDGCAREYARTACESSRARLVF